MIISSMEDMLLGMILGMVAATVSPLQQQVFAQQVTEETEPGSVLKLARTNVPMVIPLLTLIHLQQLHSYFVSTMPRPYDRQLISDTFAIDDAFMDRTLIFQNGDWLMASFKATNTQTLQSSFMPLIMKHT